MITFWGKYDLFTNCQFGFREKHSTNIAITYLHETILEERDANKSVCGMFLDFAKAFDCVNHKTLLDKLEHYGVRGIAPSLLFSNLSNRLQYTVNTEEQFVSQQLPILIGVPQDSVLGPFLFLVYINDFPNCCDSKMVLYTDDSVLLCSDKNIRSFQRKSETEKWIKSDKPSLNYKNTNAAVFFHKMHDNFCVTTQNGTIYARDVITYLGVMIDFNLTWKTHIQKVVQKLCVAKEILNKIKCYVPQSILKNVYFGLAHPYLYCGVTSWVNAALIYTHKIQVQLNNIVKIITCISFFKTILCLSSLHSTQPNKMKRYL